MSTYTGVQAKFAAKTDNTVAYTDVDDTIEASITADRELIKRWKMGDPSVQEILAGKKQPVKVSIKRHFESGNFSAIGKTLAAACQDTVTTYYAALFPEGDASPKLLVGAGGFRNWQCSVNVDGQLEESADFEGIALAVS